MKYDGNGRREIRQYYQSCEEIELKEELILIQNNFKPMETRGLSESPLKEKKKPMHVYQT